MLFSLLSLLGGGLLLFAGGHFLVKHAVLLAERLNVAPLVVGLTIVAFGTSAPELVVSLDAIWQEHPDIVIGNIVGSNIVNLLLVLGISAVITPIAVAPAMIRREGIIMLAATALFAALCYRTEIDLFAGCLLLLGFSGFVILTLAFPAKAEAELVEKQAQEVAAHAPGHSLLLHIILIIVSLAALAFGSHLFVKGAVGISEAFGIPQTVIGLTVVAAGSAAPEIITAIIAALRGHSDVAVGNILGSNIFNTLAIGGVTALVSPIAIDATFQSWDIPILLLASLLTVCYIYLKAGIPRIGGGLLLGAYVAYVFSLF